MDIHKVQKLGSTCRKVISEYYDDNWQVGEFIDHHRKWLGSKVLVVFQEKDG